MGNRSKMIKGILRKKPGHEKYLCFTCLKSGKGNPCGIQGHLWKAVSHKIHFPSPKESKTRWKEFIKAVNLYSWGTFSNKDCEYVKAFEKAIKEL